MENREAFTGISAEPEEGIDEVNWSERTTINLQEVKNIQPEVSVETINKEVIIIIAMFQEEEFMIFREVM